MNETIRRLERPDLPVAVDPPLVPAGIRRHCPVDKTIDLRAAQLPVGRAPCGDSEDQHRHDRHDNRGTSTSGPSSSSTALITVTTQDGWELPLVECGPLGGEVGRSIRAWCIRGALRIVGRLRLGRTVRHRL